MEEEAIVQAEMQKKKDEAEVQADLYTHGSHSRQASELSQLFSKPGTEQPGPFTQIRKYPVGLCTETT